MNPGVSKGPLCLHRSESGGAGFRVELSFLGAGHSLLGGCMACREVQTARGARGTVPSRGAVVKKDLTGNRAPLLRDELGVKFVRSQPGVLGC